MWKVRLQYKGLSFTFDAASEDPLEALGAGREKARTIASILQTQTEHRKATANDFEVHVDWHNPQLSLFPEHDNPSQQSVLSSIPGQQTLRNLRTTDQ